MSTEINFTGSLNDEDTRVALNLPRKTLTVSTGAALTSGVTAVTEAESCSYNALLDLDRKRLLHQASLVVLPSTYAEGRLFSQKPTYNTNGTFTVTRATTATRVNSAGLVDLVPYNLISWSEQFDNVAWQKVGIGGGIAPIVTSNAGTAPDGTLTAERVQFDCVGTTSTFRSLIGQGSISTVINSRYTQSLYVKAFSPSEVGKQLRIVSEGTNNGSIITITADWQRITINGIPAIFTSSNFNIETRGGFTTNTTADLLLWGAQLVEGTSARDYLRTETRLNIPRIDYSLGGCPNILLEPQRTNLALQSSSFDNVSWGKAASSVTANSTTSPSGIQDADTFTGDGTNTLHQVVQTVTVTNALAYTVSIYAKKNTNNFLQIYAANANFGANAWVNFDLNNGVVGSVGSSATARIENVGNGWYRCIMTATATATAAGNIAFHLINSATSVRGETNTLSTSVFLWGAQLEAGAYATSYIPTTTASVTRNADSITRNNIFTNGLITALGGTWFVELRNNRVLSTGGGENVTAGLELGNSTGISTNAFKFRRGGGAQRVNVWKVVGGTSSEMYTIPTDNAKVAIKWNGTTADVFVNGVKVVSATSFTTTNMEFLRYMADQFPTYLNEMALFPTPLTDAQMSMLTSDIYPTAAAAYASLGLVSESPSCLTSTTTF